MPCFEKEFLKTNGKPIIYNGKSISMIDEFSVSDGTELKLSLESFNSEWRQGVSISFNGYVVVDGNTIKNGFIVWENTPVKTVVFLIKSKDKRITVKNIWDTGNGCVESWHNGAAMYVEELPNGKRYYCNDGHPDDNFDDIVFRLEYA